jgi:hypothetical protein
MPYPIVGILLGFAFTVAWFAVLVLIDVYREVRQPQVVICPATTAEAAVRLGPGTHLPAVEGCSRWPAHRHCNQSCVEGVASRGSA